MAAWANFFSPEAGAVRWSRMLSLLLTLLLVVAVAESLARITWLWWFPVQKGEVLRDSDEPVGGRIVDNPNQARVLADVSLFGKAEKVKRPPPVRREVPETRLALELKGVVAGVGGKSGGAIIAAKDGDRFFQVGATLPGNVILDEVYPQRVVLLRNGRQETLKLVRALIDDERGGASPNRSVRGGGKRGSPNRRMGGNKPAEIEVGRLGDVGHAIRVRPNFRGGKIQGFRVSPGKNRRAFSQMGFRAGDLLTKINGTKPSDQKAVFMVLNKLQEGVSATVEITRRGRPITLELKAP